MGKRGVAGVKHAACTPTAKRLAERRRTLKNGIQTEVTTGYAGLEPAYWQHVFSGSNLHGWYIRDALWCSPPKSFVVLCSVDKRNRQKSPLLTETGLLQPDAGDLAEAGRVILSMMQFVIALRNCFTDVVVVSYLATLA